MLKIDHFNYDENSLGCGILPNLQIFFEPFMADLTSDISLRARTKTYYHEAQLKILWKQLLMLVL